MLNHKLSEVEQEIVNMLFDDVEVSQPVKESTGKKQMLFTMQWEAGLHIPFDKQLLPTLQAACEKGLYTVQFFLGQKFSYKRTQLSDKDIQASQEFLTHYNMNVFTHAPYTINLAGSVDSLAWQGNTAIDTKVRQMIAALNHELRTVAQLSYYGNSGVVVHPGAFPKPEEGLQAIAHSINQIEFCEDSMLLLENSAGEGNSLARDFEQIATIIEGIDEEILPHIGVCLDTAHIHGMGQYDLSTIEGIDQMLTDFDSIIGLERLYLLHLNDSKVELGSRVDRHENLGEGRIWSESQESLRHLLQRIHEHRVSICLETPNNKELAAQGIQTSLMDMVKLQRLWEETQN